MDKSTIELLKDLKKPDCSLTDYLSNNQDVFINENIEVFWNNIIKNKNLSKSYIINEAEFSYCYFYEVINGRKAPTKDKVVRLALAVNMTVEECQQALRNSGRSALFPINRRDSIIIYAIEHKNTIAQCNNLLRKYGEDELK